MLHRGGPSLLGTSLTLQRVGLATLRASLLLLLVAFAGTCAHVLARAAVIEVVGERRLNEAMDLVNRPRAAGAIASQAATTASVPRLQGLVTRVEEEVGTTRPRLVAVSTGDGRTNLLYVDPSVNVTAAHLREHMALGEPVTALYRRTGEMLVAVAITD